MSDKKNETSPRIYTVVPVFNRVYHTEPCLEQLFAQKCSLEHTVIVVDDGSSDGTSEMICKRFPKAVLIQGEGKWYWTGSVYQGVERALKLNQSEDDYIFVLNDDLEFETNLLQKLVDFQKSNPDAVVQALGSWVEGPDKIHFAGFKVNPWLGSHYEQLVGEKIGSFPEDYAIEADALTGRGVLFPIQVFKEIGNYDRRIVHRGDYELPYRAKKAGWRLLVYFGAKVYTPPLKGKGNINEQQTYHLKDMPEYFFGVLSSSNFVSLWWISRSYANSYGQAIICFGFMVARHGGHFVKNMAMFKKLKRA